MRQCVLIILLLFPSLIFGQGENRKLILDGIDKMLIKEHEQSLEILAQAKIIAEEKSDNEQLFLIYNNIGGNYYSMLDYGEALKNYQKAYEIAISELGSAQESTALNNIAILYSQDKKYKKAEAYFLKAYNIAKENEEIKRTALYAINLSQVCNELNETEKAREYITKSLEITESGSNLFLEAKVSLLYNCYLRNEYNEAKSIALEILPLLQGKQFSEQLNFTYLTLSKMAEIENPDNALNYARIALEKSTNLIEKINSYSQISTLYEASFKFTACIAIKDSIIKATNELNKIKNGRLFESSRIKFEIQSYQKEISDQKRRADEQRKKYYIFFGVALTIIVLLFVALRNSYISSQRKKRLNERNEEIMELELSKKKTDNLLLKQQMQEQETRLLLEKEQLKNEIESKNRKLTAKALHYSNKNELLTSIVNDIKGIEGSAQDIHLSHLMKKINHLIKGDDNGDNFLQYFEELNHGLISGLKRKHPNLTTGDVRFICYLYMNLSLKEIASIFNITAETCRKRKERISKKMMLKKSSDLYDYLYSLR